jgi:hypothetical protein
MLNARKINDEKNIFIGIQSNIMYIFIIFVIAAGQVIIIEFGSVAFKVQRLPGEHWGIAIAFGFGQLVWDFMLKFLPDKICPELGSKSIDPMQNDTSVLGLRKNRT